MSHLFVRLLKDEQEPQNTTKIAAVPKKDVRILCFVLAYSRSNMATHVKRTWGKRCDILLFMSSVSNKELPTVKLPVGEGRHNLFKKVRESFKYVYEHHINDADWFVKADDDTYMIVENLRYLLHPYSPEKPLYFGMRIRSMHGSKNYTYMSGGAGYVLSREAVRRLVKKAFPYPSKCKKQAYDEDVEMGICLQNVNVVSGDSRDEKGLERFNGHNPRGLHSDKMFSHWIMYRIYYKKKKSDLCCSSNAISFHYITSGQMYLFDYLIYRFQLYRDTNSPIKLQINLYHHL
ncbi:glycoprotein-N-acetylgalactosamine 3-beta-galactosyltransferase 1-like [Scaptodrosophila lebanonensis]|uniref:Glycoprotein-N-acetylgalactosamine 3-beta-galactosyltransferase 1 n=1 Tax=Drosophila lebanonensis TaxID=7225 RepID=A0A6J2TP65_DROLE|nr:glycoprotein-N-acetylgalactosamine 3-beta-galactosyltransferase 1-like [Scaptodrosophila lebanonensis]